MIFREFDLNIEDIFGIIMRKLISLLIQEIMNEASNKIHVEPDFEIPNVYYLVGARDLIRRANTYIVPALLKIDMLVKLRQEFLPCLILGIKPLDQVIRNDISKLRQNEWVQMSADTINSSGGLTDDQIIAEYKRRRQM
jgi:hypothetical protein